MKPRSVFATCLVLLTLPLAVSAGKVYKWVDENGQVHYGNMPPPVEQFETLDIKEPPRRVKEESGGSDLDDTAQTDDGKLQQENLQPDRAEIERKRREVMRYNCAAARKNRATLISFRRIEIPDGQGGKRRLTDEEREAKLREAERQIREFCREG